MSQVLTGTPVTGYVQLTNASPGPTAFALTVVRGQAPYTLGARERLYFVGFSVSSNDLAGGGLVTIDDGAIQAGITVVSRLASIYVPANGSLATVSLFAGYTRGVFGIVPRASSSAVTAAKTVECMLFGYVSRT
jgi:hypothetical protein